MRVNTNYTTSSKIILFSVRSNMIKTVLMIENNNQSLLSLQKEIKESFYNILKNNFKHFPPSILKKETESLKVIELKFV